MTCARRGAIRVLVTGFGRYPGVRKNPTAALMRRVVACLNRRHDGISGHGGELTVSHARARHELDALIARHQPDAMLLLGLAARARWIRIERYARVLDSPLHPDSAGQGGRGHAAGSDMPLAATGLVGPALSAMSARNIRARLSPSAGRYLCNAVYAAALKRADGRPVLFVHVPYPREHRSSCPRRKDMSWQPAMIALEQALAAIATGLAIQARRARTGRSTMA